jgi:hypothetical protein
LILYRALRSDVDPRVVAIDEKEYELVRDEGDPDADGVFLIDRFEVPEREAETFLADWDAAHEALAGRRGYLGARLYRAGDRFVEVARWSSPLMVHRARELLPPDPALYQVAG